MSNAATFFICSPVKFKKVCLVYPPTIKEVCSTQDFGIYLKLLTISQEEIEDQYAESGADFKKLLTPLEYLLNNAYNSKELEVIAKNCFTFFIHEPITFLYLQKRILIGNITDITSLDKMRFIDESNYFDFQNLVREAIGLNPIEAPKEDENPRIKAMKAKARLRDRVKAQKGNNLNLLTLLASICCMGLGLNPLNVGELSYASVSTILKIYQQKEKYELDINSLLAGADKHKIKQNIGLVILKIKIGGHL